MNIKSTKLSGYIELHVCSFLGMTNVYCPFDISFNCAMTNLAVDLTYTYTPDFCLGPC